MLTRALRRLERGLQLVLRVDVDGRAVLEGDAKQRRSREEDAPARQQVREQLVEERDQEVCNVRAVSIGVGGDDDLAVAQLVLVERGDEGGADDVLAATEGDED